MSKDDEVQGTSISQARTLEEIADFWDSHSLDDYWDQTHEVEFDIRAKRRRRVTLDPDIYEHVAVQARARGISPETLVNLWLAERLNDASSAAR
jgi:CopG antitoxin of type II toxin-antitoxin system